MSNYPNSLDSLTNPAGTDRLDAVDHAANHAAANDAIVAIETELGTLPKGSYGSVKLRLAALDTADSNVRKALARTPEQLIVGTVTRDSNGAATSASLVWPDGTVGTYTATTVSSTFPGAVDAYTVTYGSPVTATYTQPLVTRNANGAVTVLPSIVVT